MSDNPVSELPLYQISARSLKREKRIVLCHWRGEPEHGIGRMKRDAEYHGYLDDLSAFDYRLVDKVQPLPVGFEPNE